ncbi:MAG: preprotein translocase subunit YajC [Bifidobacteriaceae bacterium]|nr:preprotein translocase subunit YajC [Bifidobacteriaceae bacterium]
MGNSLVMVIVIIAMVVFMWWSMRKQKKQQQVQQDWRHTLKPGDPVATVSGLLGTVKEIDIPRDQIVIDSEGSLSRWRIQAIVKAPVVPAYVSDDDVDDKGNPLPEKNNSVQTKTVEVTAADTDVASVDAQSVTLPKPTATNASSTEPHQAEPSAEAIDTADSAQN